MFNWNFPLYVTLPFEYSDLKITKPCANNFHSVVNRTGLILNVLALFCSDTSISFGLLRISVSRHES